MTGARGQGGLVVLAVAGLVILLGVYPAPMIELARALGGITIR